MASDATGFIRYVRGDVFITKAGGSEKVQAKREDNFFEGDKIESLARSYAILSLQDGSTLKIDPNTRLEVKGLILKSKEGLIGTTRIIMEIGGVMVNVAKKLSGPPPLEVETKKGIAFGVRGTQFYTFSELESEDIWTVVREGVVEALDYRNDDSEPIEEGNSMVLLEGEKISKAAKFGWVGELTWNFDPTTGTMESGVQNLAVKRQKELGNVLTKITSRKKRPFLNSPRNPRNSKNVVRTSLEMNNSGGGGNNYGGSANSSFGGTVNFDDLNKKQQEFLKNMAKNAPPNAPTPALVNNGNAMAGKVCERVLTGGAGISCVVKKGPCGKNEFTSAAFIDVSGGTPVLWTSCSNLPPVVIPNF